MPVKHPSWSKHPLKRSPFLELLTLEDRSVPATISGTVFNDLDADGVIDGGEAGQSGITIYNDINNNSMLDPAISSPNSIDVPKAITSVGTPTVTSTLLVTGLGTIVDVNVKLSITHTYDADLDIFITSPSLSKIELSSDNGGNGDNYTNTVFDDEATTPITSPSSNTS